ncbi:hypothetical protein Sango_0606300 [Sesamum angolense]|uniref:Transmembrane protein n=1 Tax=Sesamum angolense TaxID=2727404 RepID=A0AAE1X662_9LAMI|nr:hypothetical protein Sango_0606300 [Sesamum angolense]
MEKLLQQQWWRAVKSRLSYKNATVVVCLCNVITALLLLQGFFGSSSSKFASPHKDECGEFAGEYRKIMQHNGKIDESLSFFVFSFILNIEDEGNRVMPSGFDVSYWKFRYIKESEDIRRTMVPLDLIKRVREIRQEVYVETEQIQQKDVKQTAAVDLISRLNNFRSNSDAGSMKALEEWRKRKMERARQRSLVKNGTTSSHHESLYKSLIVEHHH